MKAQYGLFGTSHIVQGLVCQIGLFLEGGGYGVVEGGKATVECRAEGGEGREEGGFGLEVMIEEINGVK